MRLGLGLQLRLQLHLAIEGRPEFLNTRNLVVMRIQHTQRALRRVQVTATQGALHLLDGRPELPQLGGFDLLFEVEVMHQRKHQHDHHHYHKADHQAIGRSWVACPSVRPTIAAGRGQRLELQPLGVHRAEVGFGPELTGCHVRGNEGPMRRRAFLFLRQHHVFEHQDGRRIGVVRHRALGPHGHGDGIIRGIGSQLVLSTKSAIPLPFLQQPCAIFARHQELRVHEFGRIHHSQEHASVPEERTPL
ncbi:hypothetical protein QTI66_17990 [Variovorax sp. J22R133]|uniref:hypothetical protein n=1 Tax=Variovorax brevis TaxID=3053503 RepID=UPI0025786AD3|nr:hypothetical protein [Variovorax sp. J22R133]MDM0114050.1 hypothetical protein [Variovorax sp. J22R133]